MSIRRDKGFYMDLYDDLQRTGETIKDASNRLKLSPKTVSNWFSKIRKGEVKREVGTGKAGSGKRKGGKSTAANDGKQKKSRTPSKKGVVDPPRKKKEPHPNSLANLMPIVKGEQRALKHGGYAQYFAPDITDEVDETTGAANRLDSLIRLTDLRLRTVLKRRAEWDAKEDYGELTGQDYPLQELSEKKSAEGRENSTKRVRPPFDAMIDTLTGRMGWLIGEKHRIERHLDVTAGAAAAQRAEIMQRADDEGWAASTTGIEIEKQGFEVPFTLQQRIRSELALAEPEEPEGGMTDEELERLSQDYEDAAAGEDQWLQERREEVERMHKDKEQEKKGE